MANYATLNPLMVQDSNGRLTAGNLAAKSTNNTFSTIPVRSGKWYIETTVLLAPGGGVNHIGVGRSDVHIGTNGWDSGDFALWREDGIRQYDGNTTTGLTSYTKGDVISILLDCDNETITWWKNGSAVTNFTNLPFPSNFYQDGKVRPITFITRPNPGCMTITNFGQTPFIYDIPTGYMEIKTSNLPEPDITPTALETPESFFKVVKYTGNHTYPRDIDVGFQPDFVMIKNNTTGYHWRIFDRLRDSKPLYCNQSVIEDHFNDGPEVEVYTYSNGFRIIDNPNGTNAGGFGVNVNGDEHIAYCWKAAGAGAVTNTAGSITATVSANQEAGFSIIRYTGNGNNGESVGHGLSQPPQVTWVKGRNNAYNWNVSAPGIIGDGYLELNTTSAKNSTAGRWPVPGASVQFISNYVHFNESNKNYIMYCWHEIEGYSKFGTYTGDGDPDKGAFIYTGFKPAFVVVKDIGTSDGNSNWTIWDNVRQPYNVQRPTSNRLEFDTGNITDGDNRIGNGNGIDFLSNGFKLRADNWYESNLSGATFFYMAFAEHPFKFGNSV